LTQKLETKKMELELSNKQLEAMLQKLQTTQGMLVEAEKRRAIGVLAGGIIHDIGNTLTHTRTNLYALKKRILDIPADKQRVFSEISSDLEHGIKQAMSTVTLVRTYTHPNMESREQVDVREIVDSALLLTSSRWRESNIFTQVEIQPGTTIWGNKQSLVDVLVNLILNSADALLCKKFKDNEDPVIRITGGVEAGRVLIRVHDNGTGIPENIRDKVFDPYYTTKDIDKGSGLGLSMSRKTVEQFDGRIAMRSETGSFCEFTLDFPVAADH
jgi:C4-dicarboxylate-specific signal transduction histidine kinase